MTLVEFLAPLRRAKYRDRVLGVLYYLQRYEHSGPVTVQQIRRGLERSRTPGWRKIRVADVLAASGEHVDSPGRTGAKRLWSITDTGEQLVRDLLQLPSAEPEIEHDVGALERTASTISDSTIRDYVEEAIQCLRVGALRATVVFAWSGAIRTLQQLLLTLDSATRNSALLKHDPKARRVSLIQDFDYIKDRIVLLAAQELGLLDKSQKDTLQGALDLRNRCGHPGQYKPGEKRVSAFVEDLVSVVFRQAPT